jgi:O-antigen ligase
MQATSANPSAAQETRRSLLRDLRTWALGAVTLAVTLNRYTFDIAGARIKLEHLVFALLLVLGVIRYLTTLNPPLKKLRIGPLWWVAPYLAVLALSSLLNSPDPPTSIRHTAMLALLATSAVLVYLLADSPARFRLAVRMLICAGILEALFTLFVLALGRFGLSAGTQPGNGFITVPYGTLWEPNILGSFLAASGVLLIALVLTNPRISLALVGCLGLILAALGLSLSRAAWTGLVLGALVVVGLYAWLQKTARLTSNLPWRRSVPRIVLAALGALIFLGVAAPLLFPATFRGIFVRLDFRYYTPEQDPAVQARVSTSTAALDGILNSPLIGHGAGSFAFDHTGEHGEPGWISNLELHILYDSGILGLSTFLAGVAALIWRAWRSLLRQTDKQTMAASIGLLGATAALLIAFQATEGTWLGFSWVYFGLLARAGSLQTDG